MAHGNFESVEPAVCPKGCTTVQRIFLTAPSVKGDATKRADANLRQIALDFGLSDMRSAREGEPARIKTKQQREAEALQEKLRHRFAPMGVKGGTFNVKTKQVVGGSSNGGALAAMATHHATPTPGMSEVREAFVKPVHQVTDFQKRTVIRRDPDKESISKVRAA